MIPGPTRGCVLIAAVRAHVVHEVGPLAARGHHVGFARRARLAEGPVALPVQPGLRGLHSSTFQLNLCRF